MKPIAAILFAAIFAMFVAVAVGADPPAANPGPKGPVKAAPPIATTPLGPPTSQALPNGIVLLQTPPAPGDVPSIPWTRIALDVHNVRIDQALAKLFAQAGQKFELDKAVPANTRVTLRVRNVWFTTALQALLDQANLGVAVVTRAPENPALSLYKISKQNTSLQTLPYMHPYIYQNNVYLPNLGLYPLLPLMPQGAGYTITNGFNLWDWYGAPGNVLNYTITPLLAPAPHEEAAKPGYPPLRMTEPNTAAQGDVTVRKVPMLGDLPIIGRLFTTTTRAERSVFTCPHCYEQVTVVRARETPACPECGRVFQADWEVCPFDGSKRPVIAGEWRFCPICGKTISAKPQKH